MLSWMSDHSLILLLCAAWIFTFFWLRRMRTRLDLRLPWVLVLSLLHVAWGVACVKIFAILESALRTGEFSAKGAMSLFGAVFFLPPAYYFGARLSGRDVRTVFDVFAVPMIFTLLCARINCLISGCCLGLQIPGTELRWPTREAEVLYYIVILSYFIPGMLRGERRGRLYPIYMVSYGVLRFILEFFRVSEAKTLFHLSHLWAILCLIVGLSILLQPDQKKAGKRQRKKRKV